ncbi:hypothetical protein ABZ477_17480 [Microbacterium sp. NPDC019599]|uniref:hypothetical protein n=1 Tax=Microbacterium sp. NPDC019599 TaxID=3154690 RepID=UPI0033E49D9D
MSVMELNGAMWRRKHDDPAAPTRPTTPRILYPTSLEEVIELCATRPRGQRATGAGSHWSLSMGAVADVSFVETHDPTDVQKAMGRTLFDVVPGCLSDAMLDHLAQQQQPEYSDRTFGENAGEYYVHIETGKRVYQAYAELDQGDDANPQSLAAYLRDQRGNPTYLGPWGFRTLGGAGGQTVFGALTTGTHGGDFRTGPIAESVVALHLVVDGGRHFWIEPESPHRTEVRFTDDDKLRRVYADDRYKGAAASGDENFQVIRDDDVFNAVLIGSWRFGIVYSVVLRVVRQYTLHQERRLTTWSQVKNLIADPASSLWTSAAAAPPSDNRFLQIAVNVVPNANSTDNLAGITKRWNVPLAAHPVTGEPAGRDERVGPIVDPFDALIGAPRFAGAGNSRTYSPDPARPGAAAPPNFLERACADADFVVGVLRVVAEEVADFINSNGAVIGGTLAAVAALGGGAALLALLAALAVILVVLLAFIAALEAALGPRLGNTLNDLRDTLLNRSDPAEQQAGILVWQMIGERLFSSQQNDLDFEAISYAVMDGHDYFDKSCNVNVDSIEVFFDATNPMLVAYVDALLAFEVAQERLTRAFVGYFSLRFTGPTEALIGPEQFERTCVIEVAGLNDVSGVRELIDFAIMLALDPNFGGILHWGQRNPSTMAEIEARFGDVAGDPREKLTRWRGVLSRLSDNGAREGFSNAFTRDAGLEIVTPAITSAVGPSAPVSRGDLFTVRWDCRRNPPATRTSVRVLSPTGVVTSHPASPRAGTLDVPAVEGGTYLVTVSASLTVNGRTRTATTDLYVAVV